MSDTTVVPLRIECIGLTMKEGRELATFIELLNGVNRVAFDIDTREKQNLTVHNGIPHFHLLVHLSEGATGTVYHLHGISTDDLYGAVRSWIERLNGKRDAPFQLKLYGADGKLVEALNKAA